MCIAIFVIAEKLSLGTYGLMVSIFMSVAGGGVVHGLGVVRGGLGGVVSGGLGVVARGGVVDGGSVVVGTGASDQEGGDHSETLQRAISKQD